MNAMALVYSRDHRVHETVSLPRFHVEEQLVDIQAASREATRWMERSARLYEDGRMPEGRSALGNADTLIRLVEHTAYDLAGAVRDCPNGLNGPDGHAA